MSGDAWATKTLRLELDRQATSIGGLARKLQDLDDYPTDAPAGLCRAIGTIFVAIKEHLPSAPDAHLRNLCWLFDVLSQHLRYAERSRVAHVPWSMVEAAESFLRRYAGQDNVFIIRPQWAYNYGNEAGFISFYKRSLKALHWIPADRYETLWPGRDSDPSVFCFSFPRSQRLNVLLHANFAHELGHIFAARWLDTKFPQFWGPIEEKVRQASGAEFDAEYGSDDLFRQVLREKRIAVDVDRAMDVARGAIRELISDAVGIHVLGMAAYSAALESASRLDLDATPLAAEGYPPWRYRLRLMWNMIEPAVRTLEAGGSQFTPYLSWLRSASQSLSAYSDRAILDQHLRTKYAYASIDAEWENIRREALADLGVAFSERVRIEHIVALVRRLEQEIPPNEYGEWPSLAPATFEEILNAGWVRKLALISDAYDEAAFDNLNRLVLKAIESSQLQQTYGRQLAKEVHEHTDGGKAS
jgi:hypothetical protein